MDNKNAQNLPPNSRIVAYLRASGAAGQELSIPQQEQEVGRLCKENRWLLVRTFSDFASGGTAAGRDSFLSMIDYLHSGVQVDAVIFWAYSRFARDYDDNQFYLADIRRLGIGVTSITDTVPDTLDGRLMESVIAWKNAVYRRDLGRDVRRAKRFMAERYKAWMGGKPPIGYQRIEVTLTEQNRNIVKLIPDPSIAPTIVKAFEMRADGATLAEIQDETGLRRSITAIGRLLANRTYIGILDYKTSEGTTITIPDYCEPLINLELWNRAEHVRKERRAQHGYNHPRTVRSEFILTGLLKCGICNQNMSGRVTSNKSKSSKYTKLYKYYRCQSECEGKSCGARYIPKLELESLVLDELIKYLSGTMLDAAIDKYVASQSKRVSRFTGTITAIRRQLADIERKVNRVVSAITERGHSTALLAQLETLENEHQRVTVELVNAETEQPTPRYTADEIRGIATASLEHLSSTDTRQKRVILFSGIENITAQRCQSGEIDRNIDFRLPV